MVSSQWAPVFFSPVKLEFFKIGLAIGKKISSYCIIPLGKTKWKPVKLPFTPGQDRNSEQILQSQGKRVEDGRD